MISKVVSVKVLETSHYSRREAMLSTLAERSPKTVAIALSLGAFGQDD